MSKEVKNAADAIKKLRTESTSEWNGVLEIRKWRDAKKTKLNQYFVRRLRKTCTDDNLIKRGISELLAIS